MIEEVSRVADKPPVSYFSGATVEPDAKRACTGLQVSKMISHDLSRKFGTNYWAELGGPLKQFSFFHFHRTFLIDHAKIFLKLLIGPVIEEVVEDVQTNEPEAKRQCIVRPALHKIYDAMLG